MLLGIDLGAAAVGVRFSPYHTDKDFELQDL